MTASASSTALRPALPRLDSLTGLRFFAAWMVLQHHFTNFGQIPYLAKFTGFGATGVSFFFVLSGFVLTWSFVPEDTKGRFYWRRFARVWPLHAATTLIALPVFYSMRDVPYDWTAIGLSFALLHAWVPVAGVYFAGNPASWSLSCEAFFYALHPFFIRPALARRTTVIALLGGAAMLAMFVVAYLAPDWPGQFAGWLLYISPIYRVGEFLLGIALAIAVKRGWRAPIGILPAALLTGAWFVLYYVAGPELGTGLRRVISGADYPVLAVLYALVIAATASADLDGRRSLLRWKPMVLLGQWSYALYLIHAAVIYALIEWHGANAMAWTNIAWLGAVSGVCIALSAALYTWLEHPVERRLRALQQRGIDLRTPAPGTAG